MWVMFQVPDHLAGTRLDQALPQLADHGGLVLSRTRARRLIDAGDVYVAEQRVRVASRPVSAQALVIVDGLDAEREAQEQALRILLEDADLIGVDKPSGWHTQPAIGRAEPCLLLELMRLLHTREGKPARLPYLRLHHRLDRDTSGVVVLARSARANDGLAAAFQHRRAHKTYHAVVVGLPPADAWSMDDPIGRLDERHWGIVPPPRGKAAQTDFRVVQRGPARCLVEAMPRTGRTHQIRLHLATHGFPVLGDRLYGDPAFPGRLCLHASSLELPHPLDGRPVLLHAPRPPELDAAVDETVSP